MGPFNNKLPSPSPRPMAAAEDARQSRRKSDRAYHQALIKIHYGKLGEVVETPLASLGSYSPGFRKAVLVVEDKTSDANSCCDVLHQMGYNGVQVVTSLNLALEYLNDVLEGMTYPPDAIVLDLGLGFDSGFEVLRKCHAHPKLRNVPILVWTKQANEQVEAFTSYLGVKDFLVKTRDMLPLRKALTQLLERGKAVKVTSPAQKAKAASEAAIKKAQRIRAESRRLIACQPRTKA